MLPWTNNLFPHPSQSSCLLFVFKSTHNSQLDLPFLVFYHICQHCVYLPCELPTTYFLKMVLDKTNIDYQVLVGCSVNEYVHSFLTYASVHPISFNPFWVLFHEHNNWILILDVPIRCRTILLIEIPPL